MPQVVGSLSFWHIDLISVLRYHRSKQDFAQQYRAFCTEESIEFLLSILKNQDLERVEARMKAIPQDEEEKLIPTFFEILHFPEFLDKEEINQEFTKVRFLSQFVTCKACSVHSRDGTRLAN